MHIKLQGKDNNFHVEIFIKTHLGSCTWKNKMQTQIIEGN